MHDADKLIGGAHQTQLLAWQADRGLPGSDDAQREMNEIPPLAGDDDPNRLEAMFALSRSPARGIILALVPALLVWAVLIILMVRLLR